MPCTNDSHSEQLCHRKQVAVVCLQQPTSRQTLCWCRCHLGFLQAESTQNSIVVMLHCSVNTAALQADLPLVLPPPTLPASNIFADWPSGPRAWPWKGMQNVDVYFGGSELHAMGQLIYIARALEATSPAAGSTFGPTAAAAAVNVTSALKQLLLKRLQLPCTFAVPGGGANPGSLCYDNVFKLVTTARAQSVSICSDSMVADCQHIMRRC
jgi:hypothetical protein